MAGNVGLEALRLTALLLLLFVVGLLFSLLLDKKKPTLEKPMLGIRIRTEFRIR
jgi:hypothetical protein